MSGLVGYKWSNKLFIGVTVLLGGPTDGWMDGFECGDQTRTRVEMRWWGGGDGHHQRILNS